jgi:hypothetical protein
MYYISNCCSAERVNTNSDICPNCGEHCAFELVDEDEALDIEEKLGDFSEFFDREQLL